MEIDATYSMCNDGALQMYITSLMNFLSIHLCIIVVERTSISLHHLSFYTGQYTDLSCSMDQISHAYKVRQSF